MAKINVPKLEASTFKGWAFVLVAGVLLALAAIVDRGGLDELRTAADGFTGCRLEVSVEKLNVRSGPTDSAELVQTLMRGDKVDGTRTVTAGYRELAGGKWAADKFLTPLPGTNCA